MSFDNYKILNFEYHQPIFVEDLNAMISNDILIYNKINAMPRGVLAYKEYQPYGQIIRTRGADGFQLLLEEGVVEGAPSYTYLRLSSSGGNSQILQCDFDVEIDRLIEISTFLGQIGFTSLRSGVSQGAIFALAFFIKNTSTPKSQWQLLSNSVASRRFYAESTAESASFTAGSVSASHVAHLQGGSYSVRVGVVALNFPADQIGGQTRGVRIGFSPNNSGSTFVNNNVVNQLCVKDVGINTGLQGF